MKIVLGAVAAAMLAGVLVSTPAEARCWWNGYAMECWHPHHSWYHHHWGSYHRPYGWY